MKQRKDGRWVKKITLPDGKTKYFYSTAKSEREAIKDFNEQLLGYRQKEEQGRTFAAVAEQWNTEYRERISDINYRKTNKAAYARIIKYFDGNTPIKNITRLEINTFLNSLIAQNYYKKTIAAHKSTLNMIFTYAVLARICFTQSGVRYTASKQSSQKSARNAKYGGNQGGQQSLYRV